MKAVALVTDNIQVEAVCRESLRPFSDLRLRRPENLEQARKWVKEHTIHALLVDLKSFLRADPEVRDFINHLSDYLPVGKIRLAPDSDVITGTFGDENLAGAEVFYELAERVRKMPAQRPTRAHARRAVIFNIRAFHPIFGPKPFLSNTVNISQGGIFIVSSIAPSMDVAMSIEIVELLPEERWQGRVRWILPWGKTTHHYPGIGLEFMELSPKQKEALDQF